MATLRDAPPSNGNVHAELLSLQHFERAAAAGTLPQLLADLERAAAALPAGAPLAETLTLLRRAVRIDLAFLTEHPEEIFACLYNRCRFHGSAEAAAFLATAPGASVPPLAPTSSALGELLERWAAERKQSGRPWLRSLRPPAHGPAGPLLEEYRGVGGASARIRVDDDDRRIRLTLFGRRIPPAGPHVREQIEWRVIGWDRATGRRLEETSLVEPAYEISRPAELPVSRDAACLSASACASRPVSHTSEGEEPSRRRVGTPGRA